MGIVTTCPQCLLPFVVDELDNEVARGLKDSYGKCDGCKRDHLQERIARIKNSFTGCCGGILVMLWLASKAYSNPPPPHSGIEDLWTWFVAGALVCLLAAFFERMRTQRLLAEWAATIEAEEQSGETYQEKRLRLLEEHGQPIDHGKEDAVQKERGLRFLEFGVALGEINKDFVNGIKEQARLSNEIELLDEQIKQASEANGNTGERVESHLRDQRVALEQKMLKAPARIRFWSIVQAERAAALLAALVFIIGVSLIFGQQKQVSILVGVVLVLCSSTLIFRKGQKILRAWPRDSDRSVPVDPAIFARAANLSGRQDSDPIDSTESLIESTKSLIKTLRESISWNRKTIAEIECGESEDFEWQPGLTFREHLINEIQENVEMVESEEESLRVLQQELRKRRRERG